MNAKKNYLKEKQNNMSMKNVWVGICGGSASGKSTVAKELHALCPESSLIIPLDSYYKPLYELTFQERTNFNFDHPDSIDFELLERHLELLKHSNDIDMPMYSFEKYTRLNQTKKVSLKPIVIVEGMFVLSRPKIFSLLDIKIYIELCESIRLLRMIDRDTRERDRTTEWVKHQYFRDMKPMHELYVEPLKQRADEILDGSQNAIDLASQILTLVSNIHDK